MSAPVLWAATAAFLSWAAAWVAGGPGDPPAAIQAAPPACAAYREAWRNRNCTRATRKGQLLVSCVLKSQTVDCGGAR